MTHQKNDLGSPESIVGISRDDALGKAISFHAGGRVSASDLIATAELIYLYSNDRLDVQFGLETGIATIYLKRQAND